MGCRFLAPRFDEYPMGASHLADSMRHLVLLAFLMLVAAPAAEAQRGGKPQGGAAQGRGAAEPAPPAGRGGTAKARGSSEGGPNVDRSNWVQIDVDKARVRMNTRVNWLAKELKFGPAQKKRLTELFELELWAATARGVEPFDSNPNPADDPGPRLRERTITRGELEDRNGLLSTSPKTARATQLAKEEGGRGGRGGAEGPVSDPGIPAGVSPEVAAALKALRAEKVKITVKTTHPMLADLTVATLDGIIPMLEAGQVAHYLDLLGDEGLLLVRGHAAHQITGYTKLDQGVASLPPPTTTEWTVAKRPVTKRGRGGGGGRRQRNLTGRRGRNR